jgi:hypothetical protein
VNEPITALDPGELARELSQARAEIASLRDQVSSLTGELQGSEERQAATSAVLKAISRSSVELQPVLDTLVETALRLCHADRGVLFQLQGGKFVPRAWSGFSREYTDFITHQTISPDAVGTVVGRTAFERRPVYFDRYH